MVGGVLNALTKKQPKPRGFRYIPRYYNADKEAFNTYLEKLRSERDAKESGTYVPNFKGKFTSRIHQKSAAQKQIAAYNMRLFVVLIAVCVAGYYILNTGMIGHMIENFLNTFSKKDGLY